MKLFLVNAVFSGAKVPLSWLAVYFVLYFILDKEQS